MPSGALEDEPSSAELLLYLGQHLANKIHSNNYYSVIVLAWRAAGLEHPLHIALAQRPCQTMELPLSYLCHLKLDPTNGLAVCNCKVGK